MSTRGRKKQTAATRVPPMTAESADVTVPEAVEPVSPVKRTTRSRVAGSGSKTRTQKVPVQKPKRVPANPRVKKKVPVRQHSDTYDDDEFVDLENLEDPETESEDTTPESDGEFQLEMDKLRRRMTELETLRVTQQPRKRTEVPREFASEFLSRAELASKIDESS